MRRFFAYFNDCDLSIILSLLKESGVQIYNKENCLENVLPSSSVGVETFRLMLHSDSYIEYKPCFYTLGYLQCGSFSLKQEDDSLLRSVFLAIKRCVCKYFTVSQDKQYYIGPGIYAEWVKKQIRLPTLLKYRELLVKDTVLPSVLNLSEKEGFTIAGNNVRLRNINNYDLNCESFVIYNNTQRMERRILKKNIVQYDFESECIFVQKKKSRIYSLILDERLAIDSTLRVVQLFMKLDNYLTKSGEA